jgi:SepF-like predicted cell division protein (DUF552 family)
MAFDFKRLLGKGGDEEYLEIDVNANEPPETKIAVRPFVLRQFDDINTVLNSLRDGFAITIIDIKPLKSKDVIELKRAVAKLKKTVDAIEGTIAGFGENILIATPRFAEIQKVPVKSERDEKVDFIGDSKYNV